MHKEAREELRVRLKLVVLELAHHLGVTKACREFDVPRSSYYRWKQKYEKVGQSGLYRERPIAYHHPRKTSPEVVEKILELRREYQFGALRIKYYLDRYHGIKISESTVSRVLKRMGSRGCPRPLPDVLCTPNGMPKRFPDTTFRSM
jgi:transposase